MQCKQEQQLVQEAREQSDHILANLNTGLSRITTPKKRSTKSSPDSMKEILNTPCRWNEDNKGQPIYRRSFGWLPDVDEPALSNFLETARAHIEACRKPKYAEQHCRKVETREGAYVSNTKEKETKLLGQGSRSDLAEACDRILSGGKIQVIN